MRFEKEKVEKIKNNFGTDKQEINDEIYKMTGQIKQLLDDMYPEKYAQELLEINQDEHKTIATKEYLT